VETILIVGTLYQFIILPAENLYDMSGHDHN